MPVIVPANTIGDHVLNAEKFYEAATLPHDGILDMCNVTFVRPYGVIALISTARTYFSHTRKPLLLINMQPRVHQYLERVDLFVHAGEYLQTNTDLTMRFDREQTTPTLLELKQISNANDSISVVSQAQKIFSYWLQINNLNSLLHVISELCANIYQHSGDPHGMVLIQTHKAKTRGKVRVRLSIGDMGIGVRHSLENRFGELGISPLDYLLEAMGGRTSRATGRGGLGLRIVERTVGEIGGYMWLRSESSAILTTGPGQIESYSDLPYLHGTQVAVDFHAPLQDHLTDDG